MSAIDYGYGPEYEDYEPRTPRPVAKRTGKEIQLQQIIAGQWSSASGVDSYSVIGLSTDGNVYRYDATDAGWVPWSMETLEPVVEVRRRR